MKTVLPLLSERMKQLLNMVSGAESVADVGCDHGYVAIRLIESGKAKRVIASDVNARPLERALEHIREFGMTDRIETRISDGFAAYAPGEVQSAVIAGMGGRLVCSILEKDLALAKSLRELILQPQSELSVVRAWIREHGFCVADENMLEEDGKFYPMMRIVPVKKQRKADAGRAALNLAGVKTDNFAQDIEETERLRIEDRYGSCLLAKHHPVLLRYLEKERRTCEEILRSLDGVSEKQRTRREEIAQKLKDIALAEAMMGKKEL